MPKDWAKYKAEVHRLYIVEEKTVYQVRDTLREKHGFNASVRAYRMHFDEWGMKKYKATKRRNVAVARNLSSPPMTSSGSTTHSISDFISSPPTSIDHTIDARSESEPLHHSLEYQKRTQKMSDILSRLSRVPNSALDILQIMSSQWQSSPEWSSTLIQYFLNPNFDKWTPQHSSQETPAIFQLIEDYVPPSHRFDLVKSLLKADLSTRDYRNHHLLSWQELWYQACDAVEWEEARDLLYEESVLSQTSGIFRNCALVVLAERLLEGYMRDLQAWVGHSLDDEEMDARDEVLKRYREILGNFHHAREDVEPEFYRFVLKFALHQHADKATKLQEDEYRLKYIQLSCQRSIKTHGSSTSRQAENIKSDSRPSSSSLEFITDPVVQVQKGMPPTPPTPNDLPAHLAFPFVPTSPLLASRTGIQPLDQLRNRWRNLDGFTEYLTTLLRSTHSNNEVNIFAPRFLSFAKPENLFDLIYRHITDESERTSLTKAILLVAATVMPVSEVSRPGTPLLLQWWVGLFTTADDDLNVSVLRTRLLNNAQLEYDLAQVAQTSEGRNLFMDAAVALLCERFLGVLKTSLSPKGHQKHRFGTRNERQQAYKQVILVMQDRGIKLDDGWTRAFLDSM